MKRLLLLFLLLSSCNNQWTNLTTITGYDGESRVKIYKDVKVLTIVGNGHGKPYIIFHTPEQVIYFCDSVVLYKNK